ncbi:MAG: cytochrome C biogenesis protein [Ignavibacteriales bacterium]|nr:cytochrome C biogenesis protein [Ignavibacteriales bacterium]
MIDAFFNYLSSGLYENFWVAVLASFGWGILSILLSPCHLSSIPLIIGYINSQGEISLKRTVNISLVFAVGILITIALIGIVTASMGRLMGDVGTIGTYFVAVVFFFVGLYLLDLVKLPWDTLTLKGTSKKGLTAALVLGLLFGIGLGPCTFAFMAPVLGVVFQTARSNFYSAAVLLLAFAVGHCFVIVGAGTLTKKVQQYLDWTENSKTVFTLKRICGMLVILGGIYLIFNNN